MTSIPDKDVEGLVVVTKHALASSNQLRSPPDRLNLAGYSNQVQLWGADAALDFIETNWHDVINYLMEVGAAKKMSTTISMPTMGYRAIERIESYVRETLPGCKISVPGPTMTIDWADLTIAALE